MSKKELEYLRFVNQRSERINVNITQQPVTFLFGEKKEIVISNLKILKKYIDKFLDVRNSDIEASFADKNDRESMGSRSYAHHMRPNMLAEFDNAYKVVSNYLQYHVNQIKLPTVFPNGNVKYNDVVVKEVNNEKESEDLYFEKCIQVGPGSYMYKKCKKEIQHKVNVDNIAPKVDNSAWFD